MSSDESAASVSDLDRLLADCLERIDRGEVLDAEVLIGQHPQHAQGLRAFFIGNAQLERVRQSGSEGERKSFAGAAGDYESGDEIQGRYRLLELIGEGGMGAVWLAQQTTPVKRRVAIKLIRAGMDSKLVLARFDAERQALAMMDHPNIARVYDGGMTERGRPFFVMEYLRGTPLTDYCDQARLSVRDRMELFLQVCRAVQHAHARGIVHRDLKPSNILVCRYDGRPVPKVIDFGLAKALNQDLTDLTLHTAHGVMVGTPIYMSPEQAELNNLDIDTRTDVFSLGVILYELLTGTTPLDRDRLRRAAMQEVLRLIREEDPIPPSTRISSSERLPLIAAQRNVDPSSLRNSVTGDLDWIVMKAIEKERARRYETVNVLAEDIQRFLSDDVVQARPPGRLYKINRLVRRNRLPLMAAGAVLTGVLAAGIGLGWGWKKSTQASSQMQQSISQMQAERGEKQRAQDVAQQQRQAADQFMAEGILRSIGLHGFEDSVSMGGEISDAEFAALQAWAELPDDQQRIRVLEIGLSDAATARQLATRSISALRACVGFSTDRRAAVLRLLAEQQRCRECAPEIRGAACLLTAALGGTDLLTPTDVLSLKLPAHEFEKNVWQLLPSVAEVNRERLLEFLLTPREGVQPAAEGMQFGELRVLLDDGIRPSADFIWQHILRDLQKTVATSLHAEGFVDVPNTELLRSVITTLPDSTVPAAAAQLLDLIDSRPAEVSRSRVLALLPLDADLLLVERLSASHAARIAQRMLTELSSDLDQDRIAVCHRYLKVLLPKLSVSDSKAVCSEVMTILPQVVNWHESARWHMASLLAQAVRQLPPGELQSLIPGLLSLTETQQQSVVLEMLGPAIVVLSPLLTSDQVTKVWDELIRAMETMEAGESADWWLLTMCQSLAVLAGRLQPAEAGKAASDLLSMPHYRERAMVTLPAVMTGLNVLAEHLNPAQLAMLKFELLIPIRPGIGEQDPEMLQAAFNYRNSIASLLERVFRMSDPSQDGEILHLLLAIDYRDEEFYCTAELLSPALEVVFSRTDKALIAETFDLLMTSFRKVDWTDGHASNTADAGSQLLRFAVRYLDPADRSKAWATLLEFYATPGDPVEVSQLRDHNYSKLVAPALHELALQIPAEQCETHLQQLIGTLTLESPNTGLIVPQHFSVDMFAGTAEALGRKLTADSARSFVTWLNQRQRGVADNIRSLALQFVIPRLDKQQAALVWDELFAQILVSPSPEIGAIPFRDLVASLNPEQVSERWQLALQHMQKASDNITAGRLAGILMALLPQVPPELKSAAVAPLCHALKISSQSLRRSLQHVNSPGAYDDRAERAVRVLAEQLPADDRRRLADAGLEIMLEFKYPYSSSLSYQLNMLPVSDDARQIIDVLGHPAASATLIDHSLRRLEELVLRDGRSLDPHAVKCSPFSEQYGLDPDAAKITTVDARLESNKDHQTADEFSGPVKELEYPRRRFMTIHDAAEWLQRNWTE